MTCLTPLRPAYYAYETQAFTARFGACRGEAIFGTDELSPGDIYQLALHAPEQLLDAPDPSQRRFELETAANLPSQHLATIGRLTFMTTTGQRVDIELAVGPTQTMIVCDHALESGVEYVLIDIQQVDAAPLPVEQAPRTTSDIYIFDAADLRRTA